MCQSVIRWSIIVSLCISANSVFADGHDQWKYSLATGIFGLNIEGDAGFTTAAAGPIEVEVDLDFSDILDLKETAGGLSGSASKGPWRINGMISVLELTGEAAGTVLNGNVPANFEVTFKGSGGSLGAMYRFSKQGKHIWSAYGGIRYTKHEVDFELNVGPANTSREIDESWADLYLGLQYTMIITPKVFWNTKADVGGGGSEGSTTFNTGIAWRFHEHWTTAFYGQYYSVEFEEGDKGDADWYLYDADEFGMGVGITFTF